MTETAQPAAAAPHTFMQRMLDAIERLGNRMPDPAILFLWLCLGVILLSQALQWLDVKATYKVVAPPAATAQETYYGGSTGSVYVGPTEPEPATDYKVQTTTTKVKGLLTVDGVRYLFTSFVDNFRNFAAVAIILVVMIGVGLAEWAGLIGALIRRLVAVSSSGSLTFIIVLLGMISSVASDAGYLVLIPLGAVAFKSVGRNPLAGIAAAFAGVAAGFGVNFLITPLDGVLT
jgi:aminobenzoyl-glutamate transport protein